MALLQNVIARGTHAARPAAGSAGVLYFETDTASLYRDNGTSWDLEIGPMVASGTGHAAGLAPDPGSSSGTTHFLREDAIWAVPAGAASLSTASAQLTGNVSMGTGNTYFDGPSVSLAAGTWLIIAAVTVACPTVQQITAKIWDGTTSFASVEQQSAATETCLTLVALVSPGTTTTYKVSVANQSANTTIRAATPDNAAGNTASTIVAVKVA